MISVKARLDASGVVVAVEAEGHAGGAPRGANVVCAAATVLLRTAYETLASYPGVEVDGSAPERGALRFVVRRYGEAEMPLARGVGDFLLTGLSALARESPADVLLEIVR